MDDPMQFDWIKGLREPLLNTVHLVPSATSVEEKITKACGQLGMAFFKVDLALISSSDQLLETLAKAMHFPYGGKTWDGFIDLASDLEWIGKSGYVLRFENVDVLMQSNKSIFKDLISIIPDISDRWQAQGITFHIVLSGGSEIRKNIPPLIEKGVQRLEKAYKNLPSVTQFHETAVIDHFLIVERRAK